VDTSRSGIFWDMKRNSPGISIGIGIGCLGSYHRIEATQRGLQRDRHKRRRDARYVRRPARSPRTVPSRSWLSGYTDVSQATPVAVDAMPDEMYLFGCLSADFPSVFLSKLRDEAASRVIDPPQNTRG
jgi:hypothetical protein